MLPINILEEQQDISATCWKTYKLTYYSSAFLDLPYAILKVKL